MRLDEFINVYESIYEDYIFYHGTTNVDAILKNGFIIANTGGHRNSSGPYGDGIYLAINKDFAVGYARATGAVLKINAKLSLKKLTPLSFNAELKSAKFVEWIKQQDRKKYTSEALISKWFELQNYEGILIEGLGLLDQAVVYTPEKLIIVDILKD